jgi:hypothetical protein
VPNCLSALLLWSPKRWIVAVVTAVATGVLISLPTAIIENPFFGRDVAVTSWSIPVVILTAVISGLIVATYIRNVRAWRKKVLSRLVALALSYHF